MGNTQALWADAPAMTRIVIVSYLAVSIGVLILGSTFPMLPAYLTCNYLAVAYGGFFWTVLTSPFYRPFQGGMSFIMVLFELYMVVSYLPLREKEVGSGTFVWWIFMVMFLVNCFFLLEMFGLCHLYDPELAVFPSSGLWSLIIVDMCLRSLSDPSGTTNFWGAIQIPNKWYPIFLVVIFSLFSMSPMWDLIAALAVGYLYIFVNLGRCLPRVTRINSCERRCCSSPRLCFGGSWIFITETQGYDVETGARRYANLSDVNSTSRGAGSTRGSTPQPSSSNSGGSSVSNAFRAFSGSGQRLGEADQPLAPPERVISPLVATTPQPVQPSPPQQQQEMQNLQPQQQS